MEPQRLIGQPVYADDHCGRYVGLLEQPAPLRDSLAVAGEDDCFRRSRWNAHRDLSSTVVLERLGDKLSRDCAGGLGGPSVRLTWPAVDVIACLLLHGVAFIYRAMVAPVTRISVVDGRIRHPLFERGRASAHRSSSE